MIIDYPYIIWKNGKNKISKNCKRSIPRIKFKCDKCYGVFIDTEKVFNNRFNWIEKEYCGNCAKPLICGLAGLRGNYNDDGTLKPNSGRFSKEKWGGISEEEYKLRCEHNKKIANEYHEKLNNDIDLKTNHYKKVFKNSIIGYISKGQEEIHNILKNDGYLLDEYVSGMRVDIVNIEKKIAIEYNGDYWHCNPRFWSEDDFNKAINMTAKEKWGNDRRRRFSLRKLGYVVHVIWENDWVNNRNKVYDFIKKITDTDYMFEPWEFKETKPLKGRTFEDIYGVDKAKILKENMSTRRIGKQVKLKTLTKIETPNQGIFYVYKKNEWKKTIVNGNSKMLIYSKVPFSSEYKIWSGDKIELTFDVKCPHCGLIGNGVSGNMTRYHFDNCKNK